MSKIPNPRDGFYIARAEALNAYALLEQALTFLFNEALSTDPRFAFLILSKIVNTRARNEIVQRVVDISSVDTFKTFTNSLFSEIGKVDAKRNNLVHWHVEDNDDGQLALRPTNVLSGSTERMNETEMDALGVRCLFLTRVIGAFTAHLKSWAADPALHGRFLQPLKYPPGHYDLLARYLVGQADPPLA